MIFSYFLTGLSYGSRSSYGIDGSWWKFNSMRRFIGRQSSNVTRMWSPGKILSIHKNLRLVCRQFVCHWWNVWNVHKLLQKPWLKSNLNWLLSCVAVHLPEIWKLTKCWLAWSHQRNHLMLMESQQWVISPYSALLIRFYSLILLIFVHIIFLYYQNQSYQNS